VQEKNNNLLNDELIVINLGLQGFAESLEQQEVEVTRVNWAPPAGGDQEMVDLLESLM
jgi:hypothetical protein